MRRDPGLIPLSHDHQHALALCVLTERAVGADEAPDAIERAAAEIVGAFDGEILDHFQFEEAVLFPLADRYEELTGLVAELRAEHQRIAGLVTALRGHAESTDVRAFCSMLRDHVRKEESVLFERAQELMPPELLKEIGLKRTASQDQ